jgi:hypothetical protein
MRERQRPDAPQKRAGMKFDGMWARRFHARHAERKVKFECMSYIIVGLSRKNAGAGEPPETIHQEQRK